MYLLIAPYTLIQPQYYHPHSRLKLCVSSPRILLLNCSIVVVSFSPEIALVFSCFTHPQVLGDLKFLESLKLFDKENIPAATIRKIRDKYVTNPDFHPSLIKNVSSACEGLCSWVRAIEVYDRVAKVTSITPFVISCFVKSEFMIHTYQSYYVLTL